MPSSMMSAPPCDERGNDLQRRVDAGIPSGDERDEPGAALRLQPRESRLDAARPRHSLSSPMTKLVRLNKKCAPMLANSEPE